MVALYGSSQQTSQPPPHAGSEEHREWKLAGRRFGGGENMLAWRGRTFSYNVIFKIISTIYLGKERAQDGDVCVHQEDCG